MATTFKIDPETESQILSIGDEFLPTVARKVRDGEDLTDGEIAEYQDWLVGQVEIPPARPRDHCGGPSVSSVCLDCGATDREPTLRVGADTSHPSAEDMWADLGCSYDWDSPTDSGQVHHPVCTVAQLDTMTDRQILRVVAPDCCVDETLAYESMVGYARSALADMRGVETLLASAVRAYRAGDLQGCIDDLDRAERAESDYGDAPATRALRGALIDE